MEVTKDYTSDKVCQNCNPLKFTNLEIAHQKALMTTHTAGLNFKFYLLLYFLCVNLKLTFV